MYSDTNMNRRFTIRFDGKGKVVAPDELHQENVKSINKDADIVETQSHTITEEYVETAIHNGKTKRDQENESNYWEPTVADIPDPWQSPFQDDVGALENLIRNESNSSYKEEKGRGVERRSIGDQVNQINQTNQLDQLSESNQSANRENQSREDRFEFYSDELQVEELDVEGVPILETQYRKFKKTSALQVILYVTGALATGALFGYIILTLLTNGLLMSGNDTNALQAATKQTPANLPGEGTAMNDGATNEEVDAITKVLQDAEVLPAVSLSSEDQIYYMLQYGVFSKIESRDAALEQLTAKGIAASTSKTDDQYRVYAGMAANAADAKLLTEKYDGLELYVKEVVVATPQALPFVGEAQVADQFFHTTAKMLATWSDLIAVQLEQTSLTPFAETTTASINNQLQQWQALSGQMKESMGDEQGTKFLGFIVTAIEDAAKALQSYNDQVAMKHLQTAQQAMMIAILAQKDWFDQLGAL